MSGLRTLLKSFSRRETIDFGRTLGKNLKPGDVLALCGSLGSGKTTFVKGIGLGLGLKDENEVKSPTYVLMHIYRGRCPIYHLDLFRLEDKQEVENLGWDDILSGEGVVLIEWARKIDGYLPAEYLEIDFKVTKETERKMTIHPHGKRYQERIKNIFQTNLCHE